MLRPLALALFALASAGVWRPVCAQQVGGISIDAEGVVRAEYSRAEAPALARKRKEAFARAHLPEQLTPFTESRVVSLRALNEQLKNSPPGELSDDVRYLFGLLRIDYVFVDDAAGDVVLCGPAEGFAPDPSGRMVGLTTGRPPLCLDDLRTALVWARQSRGRGQIGCSIDPDRGRLEQLQDWVRRNSTPATRDVARDRYQVMARILGRQEISVFEVPLDSHFARVLVEADYRMKLIALGKENPPVPGIRSQLSLLTPQGNSLQRWWFVPLYDPIESDEAGLAFRLSGQRAQLMAQEEWSDGRGRRSDAGFTRASTQRFAQLFTENFPELADRSPVFAELQNVFDAAVVAALLDREGLPERLGWKMDALLDTGRWPLQTFEVPRYVDSQFTTTNRSQAVLGLIGGVSLEPREVLSSRQRRPDLASVRAETVARPSGEQRVWWDR